MASKANFKTGITSIEELLNLNSSKSEEKEVVLDRIFNQEFAGGITASNSLTPKTLSIEEWEEMSIQTDRDQ